MYEWQTVGGYDDDRVKARVGHGLRTGDAVASTASASGRVFVVPYVYAPQYRTQLLLLGLAGRAALALAALIIGYSAYLILTSTLRFSVSARAPLHVLGYDRVLGYSRANEQCDFALRVVRFQPRKCCTRRAHERVQLLE